MGYRSVIARLLAASALASSVMASAQAPAGPVLPPPPPPFAGQIGRTPADSRPVFAAHAEAPAGAPNVLLVMTDDVGFAATSTFGGLVPTPTLDALARRGLRYNNFHTTAMCSPSRAALLTGRNSHNAGMGALSEFAAGYPGYTGEISRSTATVAEILRQNGYNTAFFGKHHGAVASSQSAAGPFDSWPTGLGFEHFYGFVGSATDQWHPALVRGNDRVAAPPGQILDHILTEDAIDWVRSQKASAPDKPFFLYMAPGTAHAPLQAPADWIAKFRGKFDQGWDAAREDIFARQQAQGIVPQGTRLTPRPSIVPAWDSLTRDQQRVASRLMEVYAAQLAYQDHELGRLIGELERMGQLDNTLVIVIQGDNGASSEGGSFGTSDDTGRLVNQQPESDAWLLSQLDAFGGPHSRGHYPIGWAWAMGTPFQYFKRYASHLGGIRNGMVTSWPARITQTGGLRPQFEHLIDIVPTILDAAGIAAPSRVNGVDQKPMDGQSYTDTFTSGETAGRHHVQYFEMLGNRSIYKDGWMASTIPPEAALDTQSTARNTTSPLDYRWALYDLRGDFSQSTDVSQQNPEKLRELQALWWSEAERNQVLPIDASISAGRALAEPSARIPKRARYVYWGVTSNLERAVAPPILTDSFMLTADLSLAKAGASGVVAAVGDEYGGWSLFIKDGRPIVVHAFSQQRQFTYRLESREALPAGPVVLGLKVDYARGSRNAEVVLTVNGKPTARATFANHINMVAQGEGFAIGQDTGLPVTSDYSQGARFEGEIRRVQIDMTDQPPTAQQRQP